MALNFSFRRRPSLWWMKMKPANSLPERPIYHYKPTRVYLDDAESIHLNPDEVNTTNYLDEFYDKFKFIDAWAADQQRRHEIDRRQQQKNRLGKVRMDVQHHVRNRNEANIELVKRKSEERIQEQRKKSTASSLSRLSTISGSEYDVSRDSDYDEKEVVFMYQTAGGVDVYGELP